MQNIQKYPQLKISNLSPKLNEVYSYIAYQLQTSFKQLAFIESLSKKSKKTQGQIILYILLSISFLTLIPGLGHFISTFFSILYPGYRSAKCIKSNSKNQFNRWMTYWLIFGFMTVMDGAILLLMSFLPCYYLIKMMIYFCLYYPKTDISMYIYEGWFKEKVLKLKIFKKN